MIFFVSQYTKGRRQCWQARKGVKLLCLCVCVEAASSRLPNTTHPPRPPLPQTNKQNEQQRRRCFHSKVADRLDKKKKSIIINPNRKSNLATAGVCCRWWAPRRPCAYTAGLPGYRPSRSCGRRWPSAWPSHPRWPWTAEHRSTTFVCFAQTHGAAQDE